MKSNICWLRTRAARIAAASLLAPLLLLAQGSILTIAPAQKLRVKRNSTAEAKTTVQLQSGFHVNSDKPADAYLIPLKLTWQATPLEVEQVTYPKPKMEKYEFSETPLSVFTDELEWMPKFKL